MRFEVDLLDSKCKQSQAQTEKHLTTNNLNTRKTYTQRKKHTHFHILTLKVKAKYKQFMEFIKLAKRSPLLLFLCSLPRSVKKALEPLANTSKAWEGSIGRNRKTFSPQPTKSLTLQWFFFSLFFGWEGRPLSKHLRKFMTMSQQLWVLII